MMTSNKKNYAESTVLEAKAGRRETAKKVDIQKEAVNTINETKAATAIKAADDNVVVPEKVAAQDASIEKKPATRKKTAKKTAQRRVSAEKGTAGKKATRSKATSTAAKGKKAKTAKKSSSAGKTLVIVESPTKAKTLTKILGSSYVVKASVGHIIDLPKSRLGIDIENDFKPEYILVKGKAPIKAELLSANKTAKKTLLASDPDREGEAIAWHIANLLGIDPSSDCRIKFHEITSAAVKSAVKEPSPIDMNLVNAQQARRVLDRLVGYTLSPLLWNKIKRGLSAGRVQSVALSILCAREDEINAFVPKDYWNIYVNAIAEDGRKYKLHLERENGKSLMTDGKTLSIDTPEKVDDILAVLKSEPLTVASYVEKQNSRKQPAPFKTSTLQQMAASRLGFSPRRTMGIAQSLFEGISVPGHGTVGLITYMRTDSLRMAPEAISQARQMITSNWGKSYLPRKPVIYQADSNAQDAHEAIRPTDFSLVPDSIRESLSPEQYKLYDMIWRRSIASQMSPAIVNNSTLDCTCGKYGLRAQGSSIAFMGWGAVWTLDVKDTMLDKANVGERLDITKIEPKKEQTKPPSRYTESSLIKTLEDDGIGRPSTYASIVETLYDRFYVTREKERKLKPTELGQTVNKFLLAHFDKNSTSPIIDVGFTSSMETSLDKVESGTQNWIEILKNFWEPFTSAIEVAQKSEGSRPKPQLTGENCPICGRPLVKRVGRFGEFIGCSGFPECHYIKPVLKKIGVPCPKCGATHGGEVVQHKSKKGRTFYGCSRYPDCDYVTWDKPKKEGS